MSSCPGKRSWPELVGTNGEAAKVIIERENERVRATTVKEGSVVTHDFLYDRVRIIVNYQQIVTGVPKVGRPKKIITVPNDFMLCINPSWGKSGLNKKLAQKAWHDLDKN